MRAHHVGGVGQGGCPADMVLWSDGGLVLYHRLRRRSGFDLALVRWSVFAE